MYDVIVNQTPVGIVSHDIDTSKLWSVGWLMLSIALVLAFSLTQWRLEAVPIAAPWDVFILLDGSWRISTGQIPHIDYHNPIGPFTYMLGAAGMLASGPSLGAISRGNSLFLLCLVPVAIHLMVSKRLSGLNIFLFVLFLSLVAMAPRPLGFAPEVTSYAMLYNRYGWILLAVLTVQLALASHHVSSGGKGVDDLVTGILLGVLFFCKVNYFAAGLLLTACAVLGRLPDWRWRRVLRLLGGFAAICVVLRLVMGVSVYAYLADIVSAATAQSRWDRVERLTTSVVANTWNITITAVTVAVAVLMAPRNGRDKWELVIITALVAIAAILVSVGNTGERSELPLFFVAGIVICQWCLPLRRDWGTRLAYTLMVVTAIGFFAMPILANDVLAHVAAARYKSLQSEHSLSSQSFGAEPLRDFYVPPQADWRTAYWRSYDVPRVIREGIVLLKSKASPQSRVFTVALADPFSFALGLPSPRGVPLWWDLNLSFDERVHPNAGNLFSNVDLIMVPVLSDSDEGCCKATVKLMLDLYGAYIRDHFAEVGRSNHWQILERRRCTAMDGARIERHCDKLPSTTSQ